MWDPLTGDIAQLLPIVRAGCALGTPEDIGYAPDLLPYRQAGVNREGRLCVQIGVLASPREPFTSYQMIGLKEIVAWLDSWQIARRWPAGTPAPFRAAGRVRSRAMWALGGHFGASQVPDCDSVGPGGIDIDQIANADTVVRELPEPAMTSPAMTSTAMTSPARIRLGARAAHEIHAAPALSGAAV